ncbi:MAG: FkbM family methyltransferase [Verrucomicrobia bacterium]|nr:FkbM family methyltransferase [Verrucomicrobiota bacterium]MCH8510630.1 FkbM family methyltransferase [Kiritimatiellia bacterium]
MIRSLKNNFRRRRLASAGVDVEINLETISCGDEDGAWTIFPADLQSDSVVYSVGIGRECSFDLDMIKRFGTQVHAFDPTPASVEWVQSLDLPEEFLFQAVGLANFDGTLDFYAPLKDSSAHYTPVARYKKMDLEKTQAPVRKLGTLMRELGHDHIDLLKIDIEGGEYAVIPDMLESSIPVKQFLLEFHHNYTTIPLQKTLEAIQSLRKAGYQIFAISERTYEMSFIRDPNLERP